VWTTSQNVQIKNQQENFELTLKGFWGLTNKATYTEIIPHGLRTVRTNINDKADSGLSKCKINDS
jgi:hypothetical protein